MRARILAGWVCLGLGLAAPASGEEPEPTLVNAEFKAWAEGRPSGWTVEVGATAGEGESSRIEPGPEGGLRLAGDAGTRRWLLVRQALEVPAGAVVRLRGEVRARGLQREAGQFSSAYVAIGTWAVADGAFAGAQVESALREAWTPVDLVARVAEGHRAGPAIFLSMTGALEARGLRFERVPPAGAFDLLVDGVARSYSFLKDKGLKDKGLKDKGLDWRAHAAAHRARALAAPDEAAFVEALRDLLAPLEDLHVWITTSKGEVVPTYTRQPTLNVEGRALLAALRAAGGEPKAVGKAGLVATLDGDLGYLGVHSLQGSDADHAKLRLLFRGLFDRRGILIDLRGNGGGDERRAQALVSLLVEEPVVYARRRVRDGPRPEDLSPPRDAVLRPGPDGRAFRGPVTVLLGPGCVSSGEGMALMLSALDNVRTVGQPTRGASGNPAPLALPGGQEVWFSRWAVERLDGLALEGRGVEPDLRVEAAGAGDAVLEAGLADLRSRLEPR